MAGALSGIAATAAWPGPARADTLPDLSGLSLEELGAIQITSVSKRPQALSTAPAAIFVIRSEDLAGTGADSLPEALRLAPNLHVGRFDTLGYAITARGFNGYETANKLLVLVDGRSVYSPLHSGVFWDEQALLPPDVQRIEVISGPGGTLWGANAVNGVVNVTTRDARETVGQHATLSVGNDQKAGSARVGARLGADAAARVYLQGFDRRRPYTTTGSDPRDDWDGLKAGFRLDAGRDADTVTLQGDLYRYGADLDAGLPDPIRYRLRGANILGRWTRSFADRSDLQLQAYADHADRYALSGDETVDSYDLQLQYALQAAPGHAVVVGAGHRLIRDDYVNPLGFFQLDPQRRWMNLSNLFVQDEIALAQGLALTVGIKLERSSFSGFDYLPNLRLAWQPDADSLLWAAVSRAARTPSRIERDLVAPGLLAKGDFDAETLVAFEAGYRGQPTSWLSLSLSTYYNLYDGLRTTEFSPGGTLPVHYGNGVEGHSYGAEFWADIQVLRGWRLGSGVTAMGRRFHVKPGRVDAAALAVQGNDPDFQLQFRSQMALAPALALDVRTRVVDDLARPAVAGYVAVDARLGWHVAEGMEIALSGLNLFDHRHAETGEPPVRREFRRSVQVSTSLTF